MPVQSNMTDNPALSPQRQPEDADAALRLKMLGEFVGQETAPRFSHRHPELVSGSIPPPALSKRRQAQSHRQVHPLRVLGVDQVDLPLPMPVLELLLPGNGVFHVAEHLEVDEPVDLVAAGEARQQPLAMLDKPLEQVRSDPDVDRAVVPAREEIDARIALLRHGSERAAKWTLKQVQGDEERTDFEILRNDELVSAYIGPQSLSHDR